MISTPVKPLSQSQMSTSPRMLVATILTFALVAILALSGCSSSQPVEDLAIQDSEAQATVNFFSPMEKASADSKNTARTASDMAKSSTG